MNGTLIFSPGQTSQSFNVPIIGDTTDEPNETILLGLSTPVNALIGTPSAATLTILDDDNPPTVQFSMSSYPAGEGAGTATITVTLSAASEQVATVDYAATAGTA